MNLTKNKGIIFTIMIVITLTLTGCCEHVWVDANCTTPMKCSECGMTKGDVVHSWMPANCTTPETCSLCGATQGAEFHKWVEANCTAPKTCSECGKTEGDVVHTFEIITCTEPSVCSKCGAEGQIIGHTWEEATCAKPQYCKICNITEGESIGHSTRRGDCTKCGEHVDTIAYKDGFAVVTYSDTAWMQEYDDFTDIYVVGTIVQISKMNDITIIDAEGKNWTVDVGTACDLSSYIGTECEVYGFSTGGISSQHKTPLINMSHDNNRIVFIDGKELYPENFESTQQFADKYTGGNNGGTGKVWIPTDGGSKYHSKASCSGMYNPEQVTEEDAIERGFGKCGKCW